jgi:anion-transporting  ArsA/GET3 family ATPase
MLKTIFIPNNSIASYVLLYTKAGMRNESYDEIGIAHLTEHVLLALLSKNMKKKYGMTINGYTRKEYTTYVIHGTQYDLKYSTYLFEELIDIIFNFNDNSSVEEIINKQKMVVSEEEKRIINNSFTIAALNKIQSEILNDGLNNNLIGIESKIMQSSYSEIKKFISNNYNYFIIVIVAGTASICPNIINRYEKYNYMVSENMQSIALNAEAPHKKFTYYVPEIEIRYTGWSIDRPRNLKEHIIYDLLVNIYNATTNNEGIEVKYLNYSDQAMIMEINKAASNNTCEGILKPINIGRKFHSLKDSYVLQLTELLQTDRFIADFAVKANHLYNETGEPDYWLTKILDITENDVINALCRLNSTIIL